jgi:uncharacterized YccA/Bax inhibitor family protein
MTLATGNPAFANHAFEGYEQVYGASPSTTMTVQGTIGKSFLLLGILSATAIWSWTATSAGNLQPILLPASAIGGFILALITIFRPQVSPWTAPVYAAFEGVFLGMLSFLVENQMRMRYPALAAQPVGIVFQAVALTGGTLFCMLTAYSTGLIKVTDRLRGGIVAATGAICLVYLLSFVLRLFGTSIPFIHGSGMIGIGFSLFVVGLAAFNLLLDFDSIEQGARNDAPKFMEWYGAFGLMVTLVWLYLEILRLLRKLQDRR